MQPSARTAVLATPARRDLIAGGAAAAAALLAVRPALAQRTQSIPAAQPGATYPFDLPALPYRYDALAPVIDAETMELHHSKHHRSYVDALNKALEPQRELHGRTIEQLLRELDRVPPRIRTALRNNGGGHANHQLFWKVMQPGSARGPEGALREEIDRTFGSFDGFKQRFVEAGAGQFGSGWAWLVTNGQGRGLEIVTTPNQDSVLMQRKPALLGNDLWEHAYYLSYRNRRPEYLNRWFEVVNWTTVGQRLEAIRRGDEQSLGGPAR